MTTYNYADILEALQRAEELENLEAQANGPEWLKRTCKREARLLREAMKIVRERRDQASSGRAKSRQKRL